MNGQTFPANLLIDPMKKESLLKVYYFGDPYYKTILIWLFFNP